MEMMSMVAEHIASLLHPPSLMTYVPPQARYERQMVSPLPQAARHRRRQDHPHGQVIHPPEQVVDLVSDDDEM
jgi:hypothetical protein